MPAERVIDPRQRGKVARSTPNGPGINQRIDVHGTLTEVDCLWRGARLIVQLDGFAHHGTRAAFERDRELDRTLKALGWQVIRVTWLQLHESPKAVEADLRALLATPAP